MKNEENFDEQLKILKNTPAPPGPPQDTIDKTLEQIARERADDGLSGRKIRLFSLAKLAAAAAVLMIAAFAVGQMTASTRLNAEQFARIEASVKASLEPSIRQQLQQKLNDYIADYVSAYDTKLKSELEKQFDDKLNKFAVQTLSESSTITNQLFTDLINTINAAQQRERLMITAALEQLELNQMKRAAVIKDDLTKFAVQTEDELNLTRKGLSSLLALTIPTGEKPEILKEQNDKE